MTATAEILVFNLISQVGLAFGRSLGRDWRRRPCRALACWVWGRWTDQLLNDTGLVLWRQAVLL